PRKVSLAGASVESIASGFGIEDRARRTIAAWDEAAARVEDRFRPPVAAAPEAPARHTPSAESRPRFPERFAPLMKLVNNDVQRITTGVIAQAAAQEDRLSRELLGDATDALGWALAQAITLVNPGRIVIGGGVSLIGQELFFEPLREACQAEVFQPFG